MGGSLKGLDERDPVRETAVTACHCWEALALVCRSWTKRVSVTVLAISL